MALAIDYVRLAVQGQYDVGVLMSTDTDLKPALEAVDGIKTVRVHMEVGAWRGPGANKRLSLAGQLPWCHQLSAADYALVADSRNYNKP